jgi:protocatechuate 4,5-dioxygenase alpha chain
LERYPLTAEQRRCVLERDWPGMLKLGANIYHMSKLGGTDRKTFQYLAGCMAGMSQEDYRNMMLNGGRSVEGNRSKSEQPNFP